MSPVAALDFYHKLVKIVITMKPGNGITADQLSGMTVTISGQQTEGTCDIINNGDVVPSFSEKVENASPVDKGIRPLHRPSPRPPFRRRDLRLDDPRAVAVEVQKRALVAMPDILASDFAFGYRRKAQKHK